MDYERRAKLLAEVDAARRTRRLAEVARELLERPSDDRLKLLVTTTLLRFRREQADPFATGMYAPLRSGGPHAAHLFGFAPIAGGRQLVLAVPRLLATLMGTADVLPLGPDVCGETTCEVPSSPAGFRNLFTDRPVTPASEGGRSVIRAADAFADLPLALLTAP